MTELSALQDSLLVLAGLKNQLEPTLRTFKRHSADEESKAALSNYLLILVASFLQEWQKLERLGASTEVRQTHDAAKPAVARIREWRSITRLRSSMLAHGFRSRSGDLINPSALFGPGLAPSTYAEQTLLAECAVYAIATAVCQHESTIGSALSALGNVWPDEEPLSYGIQTKGELEREIELVRSAIVAIDPDLEACFSGKA